MPIIIRKKEPVKATDLVWVSIIHEQRYYTNADKTKFEKDNPKQKFLFRTEEELLKFQKDNPGLDCPFEKQARKTGNNMHAHVIVSKRDCLMKQTLSPHGRKDTFSIVNFQKNNQETFQMIFDYKKGYNLHKEMQVDNLSKFINDINDRKVCYIDQAQVFKIAEKSNWNGNVLSNIKQLNNDLYRSKPVEDPYRYLEIGSKLYWQENKPEKINEEVQIVKRHDDKDFNYGTLSAVIYGLDAINNELDTRPQENTDSTRKKKRNKRKPNID
jgi:hypothetical protein